MRSGTSNQPNDLMAIIKNVTRATTNVLMYCKRHENSICFVSTCAFALCRLSMLAEHFFGPMARLNLARLL